MHCGQQCERVMRRPQQLMFQQLHEAGIQRQLSDLLILRSPWHIKLTHTLKSGPSTAAETALGGRYVGQREFTKHGYTCCFVVKM